MFKFLPARSLIGHKLNLSCLHFTHHVFRDMLFLKCFVMSLYVSSMYPNCCTPEMKHLPLA